MSLRREKKKKIQIYERAYEERRRKEVTELTFTVGIESRKLNRANKTQSGRGSRENQYARDGPTREIE